MCGQAELCRFDGCVFCRPPGRKGNVFLRRNVEAHAEGLPCLRRDCEHVREVEDAPQCGRRLRGLPYFRRICHDCEPLAEQRLRRDNGRHIELGPCAFDRYKTFGD